MRDVFRGTVVAAPILLLSALLLAGGAWAECVKPPRAPQMPQGATASDEEMKEGRVVLNLTDEVVAGTLLTRSGKLVHPLVRQLAGLGPLEEEVAAPAVDPVPAAEDEPPADTYRLSNGD